MLKDKIPPHGYQLWVPKQIEIEQGISRNDLVHYFGFSHINYFKQAIAFAGLDRDSYLEELSGWKCRKVSEDDNEVRFFPPEA